MTLPKLLPQRLSRRERQIMDIIYRHGKASVADVQEAMGTDAPTYSTVRALLRILEEKEQVTHTENGGKYIYAPVESWTSVSRSALAQVVESFFGGSTEKAVATLLSTGRNRPSAEELDRLEQLIRQAREEDNAATHIEERNDA